MEKTYPTLGSWGSQRFGTVPKTEVCFSKALPLAISLCLVFSESSRACNPHFQRCNRYDLEEVERLRTEAPEINQGDSKKRCTHYGEGPSAVPLYDRPEAPFLLRLNTNILIAKYLNCLERFYSEQAVDQSLIAFLVVPAGATWGAILSVPAIPIIAMGLGGSVIESLRVRVAEGKLSRPNPRNLVDLTLNALHSELERRGLSFDIRSMDLESTEEYDERLYRGMMTAP